MNSSSRKKRRKTTSPNSSEPQDPVSAYALDVAQGRIVAGPHVRNACARHLRDLETGHERGLVWDVEAVAKVLRFFRKILRLNAGEFEGQPFHLLPWQQFIVGSLFGWKQADGYRRFRVAYIETGKGSGKSPLAAGVGLYMLVGDRESRAEVYAAAAKKDQAKVLFRDAVSMVQQSPALADLLHLSGGTEKTNIAFVDTGSFFRPIATEDRGKGQSGPRPHCGILDEVHEHPTDAMVEFMRAGTKGRRQALILMITNSGSDRESVCYRQHDYGIKVAAGAIEDDARFAYICGLDEEDDPFLNPGCWVKANPSLGVTIPVKYLEEQVREARGMPSKQNLVLRLNFCVWTDAEAAWIGREQWLSCERPDLDPKEFVRRRCFGAIDLSAKRDLTAGAFAFPNEDGSVDAFLEFWTPADTLLKREETDNVPYSLWRDRGELFAVPGKSVDYAHVAVRLAEWQAGYDIGAVGYDRWRIEDLRRALDAEGIDLPLVEFGQGFKDMSPAVADLEEMILNGRLRVRANQVLRWNVASVVTEEDAAGNRKFTKRKSTGRIDGVVALAIAVRLALQAAPTTLPFAPQWL